MPPAPLPTRRAGGVRMDDAPPEPDPDREDDVDDGAKDDGGGSESGTASASRRSGAAAAGVSSSLGGGNEIPMSKISRPHYAPRQVHPGPRLPTWTRTRPSRPVSRGCWWLYVVAFPLRLLASRGCRDREYLWPGVLHTHRGSEMHPSEAHKESKLDVQQHQPELLMAARKGDSKRLSAILGNDNTSTRPVVLVPTVVVDIERVETLEMDSILHVVAASDDGENFLECARVIHSKAQHLLDAGNSKGDTPFHCAAKAGGMKMLSRLIDLARADGGDARVKKMLRQQNKQGETTLHEALRWADKKTMEDLVNKLMTEDAGLACIPHANGTSPLYLAVSLGHDAIPDLLHSMNKDLSYCGPDGQNVMHVAVLRGKVRLLQFP
ncbi:hypothetical protein TRIUR3_32276 [Triticum urartu]|uniref:Uncharacterized protein n=1 Tax=Triticum urartu TaxID=4572 RepID=M8A928_TRIUA|nr:hypothetical protein TRIUR3_32276 [Triticum urartu]